MGPRPRRRPPRRRSRLAFGSAAARPAGGPPHGPSAPTRAQLGLHAGPEAPGRVVLAPGGGGPVRGVIESANVNASSRGYRGSAQLTVAISVVSTPIPSAEIKLAASAAARHRNHAGGVRPCPAPASRLRGPPIRDTEITVVPMRRLGADLRLPHHSPRACVCAEFRLPCAAAAAPPCAQDAAPPLSAPDACSRAPTVPGGLRVFLMARPAPVRSSRRRTHGSP